MAAKGAEESTITGGHNILRKQVLETRTKEGGANVKNFAVPR
jgi:hypothetical protein